MQHRNAEGTDVFVTEPTGRWEPTVCSGHAVFVYDARGNGGGIIAPTITGNHQDRITDYTAIVVEVNDSDTEAVFQCAVARDRSVPNY